MRSTLLIGAAVVAIGVSITSAFTLNSRAHAIASSKSSASCDRNTCSGPLAVASAPTAATTTSTAVAATQLPTPEESAQALQDYMIKAQEDKNRAVKAAEDKSKSRIQELEAEVADLKAKLESPTVGGVANDDDKSYAFPATNKDMAEKIRQYQSFVAEYVVKSSEEKVRAVKAAEDKLRQSYEEKISKMESSVGGDS